VQEETARWPRPGIGEGGGACRGERGAEGRPTAGDEEGHVPSSKALEGLRVLVAEDRGLIASRIAQILRGAGCAAVGPVATLEAGLKLARRGRQAAEGGMTSERAVSLVMEPH
jgi:hypothetical protein